MENLIDKDIKKYVQENVLMEYELNDKGHDINHINFVLQRAYELGKQYEVDYNMLYVVVAYHDICCHINRELHEKLSARRLYKDNSLRKFFTEEQMNIMREAVEDHRASLEYVPRNIYGKILSSADRKIDIESYFKSSIGFSLKENPNLSIEELIEESYNFAIKKFGKNGYAISKIYVKDQKYEDFLHEIQYLIDNKEEFKKRAIVNMKLNGFIKKGDYNYENISKNK